MGKRTLILVASLLVAGCDNHVKVIDDTERAMSELTSQLRKVRDEASMQAAEPKLQAIARRMEKIAERARALGPPGEGLRDQLDERNERLAATRKSLAEETRRILELPGGNELFENLKKAVPGP